MNAVDIPIGPADELFALQGAYFDGRMCMSRSEVVGLDEFCRTLPPMTSVSGKHQVQSKPRCSVPKPAVGSIDALLAEHPWLSLEEVMLVLGKRKLDHPVAGEKRRPSSSGGVCDEDQDAASIDDDSDVASVVGDEPEPGVDATEDAAACAACDTGHGC